MKDKVKKNKKLILLDAHAIIHRAYHALPDFTSSTGEPTGALYGLSSMLMKIIKDLKPDYLVACYDLPEPTFRHEAYEDYKAGRKKIDDDLISQLNRSRDVFQSFGIPIYEKPGFEADDILGTIVEKMKNKKDIDIIIASGDMDTLQLVHNKKVQVYTLKKGINDTILYDEKAVHERFGFTPLKLVDFKGLRGDPSDNIIGIAGIGEKTATNLIKLFGGIDDIYKKLKKNKKIFEEKGIKPRIIKLLEEGEEEAIFSRTLALIRRDAPIDFVLKKETWKDSFDIKKVEKIFKELGFRRLGDRLQQLFLSSEEKKDLFSQKIKKIKKEDPEEIKKITIALWLINSDITNPDLDDILHFSETNDFQKAQQEILSKIKEYDLEKVYLEIELPLIPIIKKMEDKGVKIDDVYFRKLSKNYHKKLKLFKEEIWKLAGQEFNINSPKQLGEILFEKMNISPKGLKKTAGGSLSTRETELLKLKEENSIIEKILFYRETQKLLSTYIDNIPEMVDSEKRIHPQLNQAGTTTGRFSSTNPNIQNIPTREGLASAVRNGFVVEKGYKLVAFDYSQIEMRVLALLAEEDTLIKIFQEEKDIHNSVASSVFGVKESEVTKEMRRKAKIINFGIVYGMGINALKKTLESSRAEAQEFYDNYFRTFPKISLYFEKIKKNAFNNGYTETFFGRRRYFPGLRSKIPFLRASAERMAINAPLQGTAADIIKIAMNKTEQALKKAKLNNVYLIMQVHDELIYEMKEDKINEAIKIIKKTMEESIKAEVKFKVNVSVGKNWGEMKEFN